MKQRLLPALALALLLTQCQKSTPAPDPAKPEDQLPPATQTGAGTFGCLLNGQPWTPSGNYGPANLRVSYDPSYHNGTLQVKSYRAIGNTLQGLTFGAVNVTRAGTYSFATGGDNGVSYLDNTLTSPCNIRNGNSVSSAYQSGSLTLTRFDLSAHVISGTFSFKLYQPGCDTLKITQGRFDYSL